MALRVLPDAEAITIAYLETHTDVEAVIDGRVYSRIPGPDKNPVFPLVTVAMAPSTVPVPRHLAGANLDISGWGGLPTDPTRVPFGAGKAEAHDAIAIVEAALWDSGFHVAHSLGVVTGVETIVGKHWAPDPNSDRPRYILQIAVFTHPNPD